MTAYTRLSLRLLLLSSLSTAVALADGLILIPRPPAPIATAFPLEVREHRVKVSIEDRSALTEIDQTFFNPTGAQLEGQYLFPVPKGAVLSKFSMFVDGAELQAELLDAAKARKIYEDIVRSRRDPALLEYVDRDLFKVRIFPIEPRSEKRVKISYREVLFEDGGTVEYVYPLNTEKFSAQPLQSVSIHASIRSARNIRTIYCPTHEAEVTRRGEREAGVGFEASKIKPDRDFKLYYGTAASGVGMTVMTYGGRGEDGFFFLSAAPPFSVEADEIAPKDIIFVFDTSGSMSGEKMEQARRALAFCVNALSPQDRFDIVRFSTEAEALFGKLQPADEAHVREALGFVKRWKAMGGTAIEDALKLAFGMEGSPDRPRMAVFLTDGKPTIGETDEGRLMEKLDKSNAANLRVFTFGVGDDINAKLLDRLTESTRAFRTYISPEEDIEIKVSNFFSKVRAPVLTDIKLSFGPGIRATKMYPKDLPDLFKGSSLTVFGRYQGSGRATVTIEGKTGEKRKAFDVQADFGGGETRYDFIPPLWAARRVGWLLEQIRLNGATGELVDEVTQLARAYGLITPYTSHLIVEDEARRVTDRALAPELRTIGNAAAASPEFARKSKGEYEEMGASGGAGGVRASREIQSMNRAENMAQAAQGQDRMDYKDKDGRVVNAAQQVRNVQGRAFYQSGDFWNDAALQNRKAGGKAVRVQFASDAYFDLLNKEPEAAQFMSLGRNVRFVVKDQAYEIHE